MEIDTKTHKVNGYNHHKKATEKKQIVLSFSLRPNNYHIKRLKKKDFGKTKKWNTYTISRDGQIYQHFDPKYYSDYIGDKFGDKQSITIVIENMGSLIRLDNESYVNFLNESCDVDDVVNKNWMGYHYWEKISEIQMNSIVELCKSLCDQFDIPKRCIEFNHYHKDIKKFDGIVFKGNYIVDSGDLNPTFNINEFSSLLD